MQQKKLRRTRSLPATSVNLGGPPLAAGSHATVTSSTPARLPAPSSMKRLVSTSYMRGSAP